MSSASTIGRLAGWRTPKTLLSAAFRSSSWFGHDLINQYRAERFEVFLAGHAAMWAGSAIVLPLVELLLWYRSWWLLATVAVGAAQCVVLFVAWRAARRGEFEHSISMVCQGNWAAAVAVTALWPPLLPVMVLVALVPVVFAEPYIEFRRGLAFTLAAAGCVLLMVAVARFLPVPTAASAAPRWLETAFVLVAVPFNALHLMIIVWNNAAALRTSEHQLAERATQLVASRTRLATAAVDERRRLERDLHDGAQQHLVALSVLLQLARSADDRESRALVDEACGLVDLAVAEVRRIAHGIYPPLLVSGGLGEALPALASHAAVPAYCTAAGVGRHPPSVEAALYYCCSEALQNAAKHGGPHTTATIELRGDAGRLTMTVRDTGRGFDPTAGGRGLLNMADRLAAVGGELWVESSPGCGACVTAVVTAPPRRD
jgi:signal transduction histidine kinase